MEQFAAAARSEYSLTQRPMEALLRIKNICEEEVYDEQQLVDRNVRIMMEVNDVLNCREEVIPF